MSTITATSRTTTGSHILKFEGYELIKKMHSDGQYVASCRFEAADHTWKIYFYPSGRRNDSSYFSSNDVSLVLVLDDDTDDGRVQADVKFSLLRRRGQPHSKSFTGTFWNKMQTSGPESSFIERSKLERRSSGFLEDDCFTVRCDITVLEKWAVKAFDLGVVCDFTDDLCKRHHVVKTSSPSESAKAIFKFFCFC
ncbi:hypothetical protein QOZ80_7AG0568620 [Eleusine coracana subsp. coracana]|nr:hypothetical protein QOZ80_7AG0568620 [Eleusine coracana subsp. coracana]